MGVISNLKNCFYHKQWINIKHTKFAYKDEISSMNPWLFRLWGWLPEIGGAYARIEWPYVRRARVLYAIGQMHAQLHDFMTANYVVT